MLLQELPTDALALSLLFLDARDLCTVSRVCKVLEEVSRLDCLWDPLCQRWVERQPEAAGLKGVTLADLRTALRVTSSKTLFEALHKLGSWPVGVWYASSAADWCMPRGQVLVVEQDGSTFTGSLVSAATVHGPPINQENVWELDEWFVIELGCEATTSGSAKPVVSLSWCFPGDGGSLNISLDGEGLVACNGQAVEVMPSARLLQGWQPPPHMPNRHDLHFRRLPMAPTQHRLLPAVPKPGELAAGGGSATASAAGLLKQLEGAYMAVYGPHGCEVLVLSMAGPSDPPPPGCPVAGLRLQALKVVGDPNVPALKHSFVVDASQCRLGPYSPDDDPFPAPGGFARPVLSFYASATVVLHLEERPVKARLRGVGQINQTPGIWDSEWVPATLIVYEDEFRLPFTVIFEDEGISVRHAMDFLKLRIPQPGFVGVGGE